MNILLSLGYFLMVCGLAVKDILFLRILITLAQCLIISVAILSNNHVVIFWNIIFIAINLIQIILILRERRPIPLDAELLKIYERTFPILTRQEFHTLWNLGITHSISNKQLIQKDHRLHQLMYLIEGQVSVSKEGRVIARLKQGSFIAEMSFLTGDKATADVLAEETVKLITWKKKDVENLQDTAPDLWLKFQGVLGKDLVEKIKIASNLIAAKNSFPTH
jgi:hypothetical protein